MSTEIDPSSTDGTSGDFVAGGLFIAVGVVSALTSLSYGLGSLREMGPGMFPFGVGIGLAVLGAVTCSTALRGAGETTPGLSRLPWRGIVLVIGAIVFFAYGIEPLGLIPTTVGTVLLACLASRSTTIVRAVVATASITVACYLIFVLALQLQLPLYPSF